MADTAHTPTAQDSPASRQIRVFLSSTFRDFMEERDLLVKQVFPALRRRAQERGVEVVDVDLRWGVTQEESEQGKVIGICLAEIERCRPYFIGMLGERYGWTPGKTDYPDELFEMEQLGWIKDHQGDASVTELEILHGVLNDKEMPGRAFFYFRDPAWSRSQSECGFVCDTPEEEAKLAALKERIRTSAFPVKEGLPDPKAIADQIEADLWALIEEQYPNLDQADLLEKEARKHASYRQSRLGVYLGKEYVDQLEALVRRNEQKILITGESGSGKSALIANWMHQHELEHPGDELFAHHLGCSNDANSIRPLLGRMLDTASKMLMEAEMLSEPIQVPEDWWKLTAKIAETLQTLGRWCRKTGHRWIWVLDGLDRLAAEDQQALPWLPLLIPEGVSVVISALECQGRTILQEQRFQLLQIGPLKREEQEQLIETYLEQYTKKLDTDRLQQILACDLARSPLFLRVLLEELRQCGRFETLETQISDYIRPNADGSLAVNDLYERVLARLEDDCGVEPVRQALIALWASRAGLSEPELLAITGLAPLQWAPIDLALDKAIGRNSNRLVFDHDYLHQAVEDRYLSSKEKRQQAHSELADWFYGQQEWDRRKAEELPWQLEESGRTHDLRALLLRVNDLYELAKNRSEREVINYWLLVSDHGNDQLDELIAEAVEEEIQERKDDVADQIRFVDRIAALLDEAGLYRELLLRLRTLSLELETTSEGRDELSILNSMAWLADAHRNMGQYIEAESLDLRCLTSRERLLGPDHPETLTTISKLAGHCRQRGDYEQAEAGYYRILKARERILGAEHPSTLCTMGDLGDVYRDKGDYVQAEAWYIRSLEALVRVLGKEDPSTLATINDLGVLFTDIRDYKQAEAHYMRCLQGWERLLGKEHPSTLTAIGNLGMLYHIQGEHQKAEVFYNRCLEARERLLGAIHLDTLITVNNLACLYNDAGDYKKAEAFHTRCLEAKQQLLGPEHPSTLTTLANLGALYQEKGDDELAEAFYTSCLDARERLLGPEHPVTNDIRFVLANFYSKLKRYGESIPLRRKEIEVGATREGREAAATLNSIHLLAEDLFCAGKLKESEHQYREALSGRITTLGENNSSAMVSRYCLARCLSHQCLYDEAIVLRKTELTWCRSENGDTDPGTLTSIKGLAFDLREIGALEEAEALFRELLTSRQQVLAPSDFEIGRALAELAKTLEEAGKLEEAIAFAQQALDHSFAHEGPDAWWTNRNRLDLARMLHKLGRSSEAFILLDQLKMSMKDIIEPDEWDRKLLEEAQGLREDGETS